MPPSATRWSLPRRTIPRPFLAAPIRRRSASTSPLVIDCRRCPAHQFKAGFDYWLTTQWKAVADIVVTSDQYFRGDEANQNAKLPGYQRVDLRTSYDITPNVQLYGLIQNLFDKRYGLYGTYFDTAAATNAASGTITFTDPRTITPAQPFAVYGGLKVKF